MSTPKNQSSLNVANAKSVKLSVSGMSCQGCVKAVGSALADCDGVVTETVSLEEGLAEVTFDPAKTNEEKLIAAVKDAGYDARVSTN